MSGEPKDYRTANLYSFRTSGALGLATLAVLAAAAVIFISNRYRNWAASRRERRTAPPRAEAVQASRTYDLRNIAARIVLFAGVLAAIQLLYPALLRDSLVTWTTYWLYLTLGVILPGTLLLMRTTRWHADVLTWLGLGWALGHAVELSSLLIAKALGAPPLFLVWIPAAYLIAATSKPGFPFCQPDQGLYTATRLSARQISSAHVIPLPTPVSWGRARRETDWSPCFQGISQAPLHTCALSSPLRCTQAARQPPGTGSAQILRSMSPNSRRVR